MNSKSLSILLLVSFVVSFSNFSNAIAEEKVDECFLKAKEFENLAQRDSAGLPDLLGKAMENYMCSARNGNIEAGYKAATLSESGMVKPLSESEVKEFIEKAAAADILHAQLILARMHCGPDIFKCISPQNAKFWLVRSSKRGSADGANMLGSFYERGFDGSGNLDKAEACYLLAIKLGSKVARNNFERIKKIPRKKISNVQCF